MSPSQQSTWNPAFSLKWHEPSTAFLQWHIFLRGLSTKEIPPPDRPPSFLNLCPFPHPACSRKGLLKENYINLQLIRAECSHRQSQTFFFDWLHKLIFHLHCRATIYSTIKLTNPESPLQLMPWPGAKVSGFFLLSQTCLLHLLGATLTL